MVPSLALELAESARDQSRVQGLTHGFYRYPARFSPKFAAAAIKTYSKPGDLILDPYMGGGTTVVEALAANRRVVGSDINSLSVFVTRVKCTTLTAADERQLGAWASAVQELRIHDMSEAIESMTKDDRTRNLNLPNGRYLKKIIALAIHSTDTLSRQRLRDFARCAILRASQIALDGRTRRTAAGEFRGLIQSVLLEMINGSAALRAKGSRREPVLIDRCATRLPTHRCFADSTARADLVVTSPPYPGVHVLYHRWQIDGRRESPAPYWIAGCNDGLGSSHYTFGDRRESDLNGYFETSLATLRALRRVMRPRARIVQMVAFSDRRTHLRRYLANMTEAGFIEEATLGRTSDGRMKRIWREVPGRKWHAVMKGRIGSSREVVLVHRAA